MKDVTEADYEAGIPACCMLTYVEHNQMMLCWGLVHALEKEVPMDCGRCEFRRPLPQPEKP